MDMRSFQENGDVSSTRNPCQSATQLTTMTSGCLCVWVQISPRITTNTKLPVTITPEGFYDNNSAVSDQERVWPLENNNMVINFEDLFATKRERNENLWNEGGRRAAESDGTSKNALEVRKERL